MLKYDLEGKRVAVLVTHGVDEQDLTVPYNELKSANAEVEIVSVADAPVRSWETGEWGPRYEVDKEVEKVEANDYDALLIPGGLMSADALRCHAGALTFVRHFFEQGKTVGALGHGPLVLIEAGAVRGRKLTSCDSIRTDLRHAGANWVSDAVVVEAGLVTGCGDDHRLDFAKAMAEEIVRGRHQHQRTMFMSTGI